MKRIVMLGVVIAALWAAETWWLNSRQPELSSALALQQLNGGHEVAEKLRAFDAGKDGVQVIAWAATAFAAWVCFAPWLRAAAQWLKMMRHCGTAALI